MANNIVPLSYEALAAIKVVDCDEILEALPNADPHLVLSPINTDMQPYTGNRMYLRVGARKALTTASQNPLLCSHGLALKVVYAYRHPEVQARYFAQILKQVKEREPFLSQKDLTSKAHLLIASPDVAGHPSGGAVDVTLTHNGQELDMGTPIWDLQSPSLIPTFSEEISSEAKANRLFLREAMLAAGFAPFDGEWWHFSYGDKEWAAYYKRQEAIYDQVDFKLST